jgi:hypothetical protein
MHLSKKLILSAAVMVGVSGCAGQYASKYDTPVSRLTSLNNCAYAPSAAYALDSAVCGKTMNKVAISDTEMQTIRTCKWMPPQTALRDSACNIERSRFPGLFYARPMT